MGLMNKQIDLIDDAYENFGDRVDEMWQKSGVGDLDDFLYDGLLVDGTDENGKWFARLLSKEEFTSRIKTDEEFTKRWGITIETKELSRKERSEYYYKHGNSEGIVEGSLDRPTFEENDVAHKWYNDRNTPKRVITITYNGQTQEIYE